MTTYKMGETLEEYLERGTEGIIEPNVKALAKSYIRYGAEWQKERMYSEEEVLDILFKHTEYFAGFGERISLTDWFEQFKKK